MTVWDWIDRMRSRFGPDAPWVNPRRERRSRTYESWIEREDVEFPCLMAFDEAMVESAHPSIAEVRAAPDVAERFHLELRRCMQFPPAPRARYEADMFHGARVLPDETLAPGHFILVGPEQAT